MQPSPPGRSQRTAGCAFEVVVGEEVTTRGGHLLALVDRHADPAAPLAPRHRSRPSTTRAASPSRRIPLVPFPLCAQGWVLRAAPRRPRTERFHPDAIETFNPTTLGRPWHARVVRFADRARARPHRQQRCPRARRHRHGLDHVPRPDRGRPARTAIVERTTEHHGSFHGTRGSWSVFGQAAPRSAAATPATRSPAGCARRHRPRPRLSRRPPATAALRSAGHAR